HAAIAAARQNRMFNFNQVVYANQGVENTGWLNHAFIQKAGESVPGMSVPRLLADQKSDAVTGVGNTVDGEANTGNVSETATVLLGKTGSKLHKLSSRDTFNQERLAAAIRSLAG